MLYSGEIDADIIVLGNSRAVHAFHAPFLEDVSGKKVFNLAYNGLSMPITRALFSDYLNINKIPKAVFIEITSLTNNFDMLLNLKQYAGNSEDLRSMLEIYYPNVYTAIKLSGVYRYNSEYFLRTLYYLDKSDQTWINKQVISESFYRRMDNSTHIGLLDEIDSYALEQLVEIVSICHNNGIDVSLFIAPILDKALNGSDVNEYISRVQEVTGLRVIDLSDALPRHEMFSDTLHVNIVGAKVLASRIFDAAIASEL